MLLLVPTLALAQAVLPLADNVVSSTAKLIQGDTPGRHSLRCYNTHATVHARWGDVSVTATKGQRIPALSAIEIVATGPVYMISEGADVTVACTVQLK